MRNVRGILIALFASAAIASPVENQLVARGNSCRVTEGNGFCASVSGNGCPGGAFYAGQGPNWPCPGSNDIQCCVKGCSVDEGYGYCSSVSAKGCPGGVFYPGKPPNWPCPGGNDIECCVHV